MENTDRMRSWLYRLQTWLLRFFVRDLRRESKLTSADVLFFLLWHKPDKLTRNINEEEYIISSEETGKKIR